MRVDLAQFGFHRRDGAPYVEAHHVEGVAGGGVGVLRAANVMTVCAGHHRELHYGAAASVRDLGDRLEVTVEAGTVVVLKPEFLLLAAAVAKGRQRRGQSS